CSENFQRRAWRVLLLYGSDTEGCYRHAKRSRCSQVAYPGEKIMEEAKLCTHRYLTNALENVGAFDKWALKKDLQGEVEYVLRYPWHRSLPRLEARNYVEQYGANDVWLGKSMYLMKS
ncbi:hypothetical protein KI387_013460, partial [Taxus chinensis]